MKIRDTGRGVVKTANEENNPMYEFNVWLGFTELTSWVEYEKMLR